MDELTAGIRSLHERVTRLDELLTEDHKAADFREKLNLAAIEQAELAASLAMHMRRLVAIGLLLWTPVCAYAAVWFHERVRNTCYPIIAIVQEHPPLDEPWYCSMFPGTARPGVHDD